VVKVDGERFFKGRVSCVLVGNVGKLLGGIEAFDGAQPDDGVLELGVVTARDPVEWARTLGRVALGNADKSPFIRAASARRWRRCGSTSIRSRSRSASRRRRPVRSGGDLSDGISKDIGGRKRGGC
jgi:diacylglycerol kinase family enzyme